MSRWISISTNQPTHTAIAFGTTKELFLLAICSAVILLLALVFFLIYLGQKWHQTHYTSSSNASSLPQTTAILMTQQSLGLGEEAIDNLPVSVHRSFDIGSTNDAAECCICLSLFENEDRIKVLPGCQHTYHSDCVDLWLGTQSSCPLCRISLKNITPSASSLANNI